MLRYDFTVTDEDLDAINGDFGHNLCLPKNFGPTAETFDGASNRKASEPKILVNPQTSLLCEMVGLTDPFALFLGHSADGGNISSNLSLDSSSLNNSDFVDSTTYNPDEISLEDLDDENNSESEDLPVPLAPAKPNLGPESNPDLGPECKPDLGAESKPDCVDEQSQNPSPLMNSTEIIAHDTSQNLVSNDAKQRLFLTNVELKLVSTDIQQKSDVLAQCDVEEKSVLADCQQDLVSAKEDLVSADKTVNSEAKPKDDVCLAGRTLKRRNLSIYGTEEGMANDS